jgi:hypothetical protein
VDLKESRRLEEVARRLGGPSWERDQRLLADPFFRSLAGWLGVDLASIDDMHREVRDGWAALMQAAVWFAPFGWTVSARCLPQSDYIEAVAQWERDPDRGAIDESLTRAWADPIWFRQAYGPLTTLGGGHERTLDLLLARNGLLDKAFDHHMQGQYEAAVLIVLSQIDGITFDFTEPSHGFFFGAKPGNLEDDSTLAGMPEVLRTVYNYVVHDTRETSLSGAFQRSPIMHGRDLAYGTEVNSTKAFALLSGVIDWLKPRAATLTQKRQGRTSG